MKLTKARSWVTCMTSPVNSAPAPFAPPVQCSTVPPEKYAASKKEGAPPLPSLHSDLYAPVPTPSITTGVRTMSMAVLNVLGK